MTVLVLLLVLLIPATAFADNLTMPAYLFTDWRYWAFIGLYTLLTVKLVAWTRKAAAMRDKGRRFPLKDVSPVAAIVLANALVYQILHHFEHVSQIFQWWYLGQIAPISRGIVFFLDLEWNHFTFDIGYFLMLLFAITLFMRRWKEAGRSIDAFGKVLLYGALIVQGWHAVEHTYRIYFHIQTGCEPCAGIADTVFNVPLIPLHFWFNVFALTLPLLAFFYYRMDWKVWVMLRRLYGREDVAGKETKALRPEVA